MAGVSEFNVPDTNTALAAAVRTIGETRETGGEEIEILLVGPWFATRRISPEPTD